ncbi:MAG: TRAM domain-containing protein [Acidimicrobiia bacterium]|nr:TRAM domain-containing protein [Acidimicrobiia bacterium]MDH3470532.1 TRAM domain-containing protein [Acidimicrobiia bacterium]
MIVEVSRLLITVSLTGVGFQTGKLFVQWFPNAQADRDVAIVVGALLGAAIGYVVGGVAGRTIRSGLDKAPQLFAKMSGPELFAGGFGALVGLMVGVVLALPAVLLVPAQLGWPAATLVVVVLTAFGAKIFASRSHELLTAAGLRERHPLQVASPYAESGAEQDAFVIDTSAAIDGRVLELARSGLLRGRLWVPAFVVDELQTVADSSSKDRRRRGRRGLDVLDALRDVPGVEFAVLEDTVPEHHEVDAKLLAVTSRSGGTLVTTDHNLARAAELRGLIVVNPHAIGELMSPGMDNGAQIEIKMEKAGSEEGQGVGYLDDGTMVVVEGGADHIGETVRAEVANTLRTSIGRLLFARIVT